MRALLLFAILCTTLFFRFLQKTTIYVHENQCPPSKDLQNALQQQRRIPLFFLVQQQLEVNINYYIDISICLGHPKHNCFVRSYLLLGFCRNYPLSSVCPTRVILSTTAFTSIRDKRWALYFGVRLMHTGSQIFSICLMNFISTLTFNLDFCSTNEVKIVVNCAFYFWFNNTIDT